MIVEINLVRVGLKEVSTNQKQDIMHRSVSF